MYLHNMSAVRTVRECACVYMAIQVTAKVCLLGAVNVLGVFTRYNSSPTIIIIIIFHTIQQRAKSTARLSRDAPLYARSSLVINIILL